MPKLLNSMPEFTTTGTTESERNTDLAIYLVDLLELRRNLAQGIWSGDTHTRTLSNTCQAVEALSLINLGSVWGKLVARAVEWLRDLPILRSLPREDHRPLRIFPSRFKTLAMLRRFHGEDLQSDFADLSAHLDQNTGWMINVPSELRPELVTMIWLDSLLYLEQTGQDISAWRTGRALGLQAVVGAFENWLVPLKTQTKISDESTARFRITNEGDASYALDLLLRSQQLTADSEPIQTAFGRLVETIRQRRSGYIRNSDFIYCGIQLSTHFRQNPMAREAVSTFIREVRERYTNNEYSKEPVSFHALVLRLLTSYYQEHLREDILETHWVRRRQAAARQEADQKLRQQEELGKLLQTRFEIHIGQIDPLSGPRSRNEVFRVHFGMSTDATDEAGNKMSLSTDALRLIVKKGSLESLTQAIKRYQDLPEDLRLYFAHHTALPQSFSNDPSQPWYLVMEDLAKMIPLSQVLEQLDLSDTGRSEHEKISRCVTAVSTGLRAIHRKHQPANGTSDQLDRLYILPITERLDRLCQQSAFPALRPFVEGRFESNGRHYKKARSYLGALRAFERKLRPPLIGMIHGDCHSRNVMLSMDLRSAKFVDLEGLTLDEDYLVDYAILLEDVAFYRLLPHKDYRGRISWDDIQTNPPGGKPDEIANLIRYPAFPLESNAALQFQRELTRHIHEFAVLMGDTYWRERLWLAVAKALILLGSRQMISHTLEHRGQSEGLRLVLLTYAEAIRLLDELLNYFKTGESLPEIPFPGPHRLPEECSTISSNGDLIQDLRSLFKRLGPDVSFQHVPDAPAWIRYYAGSAKKPFAELRTSEKKGQPIRLILFCPRDQLTDPAQLVSGMTEDGTGWIVSKSALAKSAAVWCLIQSAYQAAGGRGAETM